MRHLLLVCLFFSGITFGSPALDTEYGFRSIAAVVTNVEKEPVYGEQVENEVVSFLRTNPRFEFSDPGYLYLKERIRPNRAPMSEQNAKSLLDPLKPYFKELEKMGIGAVLLGEVVKEEEHYRVVIQLATTKGVESAFLASAQVDGNALENFSLATKEALKSLMEWIPFDATIIRRDGYLVVLDRGLPTFQKGQTLSAYTVEKQNGQVQFIESGVIGFTQVDENLSFGKILVERRPLEVTVGNKIRLDNKPAVQISPNLWSVGDRDLASMNRGDSFEVSKGHFGVVGMNLGASIVGYSTKGTTGSEKALKAVYPSGNLSSEVWLTSRVTAGIEMEYGLSGSKEVGGTTNAPVSSNLGGFRLLGGYRINLLAPEPGPIIHFRGGLARRSFTFNSERELLFTSMTYSGILVAGGATFPVSDRMGLGFDIESLVFPGVTEEPFTSGEDVSNVSAWDFVFRSYYRYNREIDLEGRLFFARNGATFSGAKTRSLNFVETSQVTTGLQVGLSYYF